MTALQDDINLMQKLSPKVQSPVHQNKKEKNTKPMMMITMK